MKVLLAACSLSLASLVTGPPAAEAAASVAVPADAARRADDLARALHAAVGAPAMSVAVRRGDALIWSAAYGTPSLEMGGQVTTRSLFRAGSVSKLFTAMALMRLRQQGRINLDSPVQRFLPGFSQQPPITLRQLAGHLGGIRHYRPEDRGLTLRHFDSVEETANLVAGDPLVHPPGSRYVYSSFGYNVLAASIEKAAGTPFLAAVRALVFDPIRMARSSADDVAAIIPGRVAPYQRDDGSLRNAAFVDPSYKWAGGGFLTNAEELTALGAALLRTDFLDRALLDEMLTSQRSADGAETGVGIGWRVGRDWAGRRIFHHAGSQEGSRAVLLVYPDEGLSVAIMTNLFGEPALIEPTAAALIEPFLGSGPARAELPTGEWTVSGRSPRGEFSARLAVDRSGEVRFAGFAPLDGFGAAIGVPMPDQLVASAIIRHGQDMVAFVLTPYGIVPVQLSWADGRISGRSMLPGSPVEFTFEGAAAR